MEARENGLQKEREGESVGTGREIGEGRVFWLKLHQKLQNAERALRKRVSGFAFLSFHEQHAEFIEASSTDIERRTKSLCKQPGQ